MGQSFLNILCVEVVLRQIVDNLILKVGSGLYPQKRCWLLVLCYVTFPKRLSIALMVAQAYLKIMLWAAVALKYTDKVVGETDGFGMIPV